MRVGWSPPVPRSAEIGTGGSVEEKYFDEDSKVVVIFPDHGSRYMSKIYNEEWMAAQGFFDSVNESQNNIQYINDLTTIK